MSRPIYLRGTAAGTYYSTRSLGGLQEKFGSFGEERNRFSCRHLRSLYRIRHPGSN